MVFKSIQHHARPGTRRVPAAELEVTKSAAGPVGLPMVVAVAAAAAFVWPLAIAFALPAQARQIVDCPLRTTSWSVDSPLMDLLASPGARAAVEREAPSLLSGVASIPGGTKAPSVTAIMSLRTVASFPIGKTIDIERMDRALRALPVTAADQAARCARYDEERVRLTIPGGHPRLLLFEKMTGFRDGPSVQAARAAIQAMAARKGWALVVTDKGGAMTPANLRKFDAVIWNNVSGDVLTLRQRRAFEHYIGRGGGFVGMHGSAGDFVYYWPWYVDTLIGARFIGHPMGPQFQDARIVIESGAGAIADDLAPGWTMKDEWYSFAASPRAGGAHVIATLDESTYSPKGIGGRDLRMGDHPIAWTRCVGDGRAFYSAMGHRPEVYSDPHHVRLLERAIGWAANRTPCAPDPLPGSR